MLRIELFTLDKVNNNNLL